MSDDAEREADGEEFHSYPEAVRAEINKEIDRIALLWNESVTEIADGTTVAAIHPPPALMQLYIGLLNMGQPLSELIDCVPPAASEAADEATRETIERALYRIVSYGDAMFRFGQRCSARGLLASNMVQCNCGTVEDSELQRLLPTPPSGVTDEALNKWLAGPDAPAA